MKRRIVFGLIVIMAFTVGIYYFSSHLTYVEEKSIRIGTLHGGISSLDMIKYLHLDDKYNVNLKIIYFEKTLDILNSFSKGDIDIAIIPVETAGKLVESNVKLYIIAADMYQNQRLIIRGDLKINESGDLKNIRIGVFTPTGTYAMFKSYMYRIYGYTEEDLNLVNLPPNLMIYSLIQGKVDMIVVWEPFASKALSKGFKTFMRFQDLWHLATNRVEKPIMIVYVAREDFVDKNYNLVMKFLDMRVEAVSNWYNNTGAVRNMLREYYNLDDDTIDILYENLEFYKYKFINESDYIVISKAVELAYEGGYLKTDVSENITNYILKP